MLTSSTMSVGRNEPCPCGSAKKYKHCCIDKPEAGAPRRKPAGVAMACNVCGEVYEHGATLTCQLCGKLFVFCPRHQDEVTQRMQGHVLRVHPEVMPVATFDQMLGDEQAMGTVRADAAKRPEEWAYFFEYVAERQSGKARRTPKEIEAAVSKSIREEAKRMRMKAVEASGELTRWYNGAWEFLLSYGGEGCSLWTFSAKLFPPGRSSIQRDWDRLGRWTAAVGVPHGEREMGKTTETAPNAVHKWMWAEGEDKSAAPPPKSAEAN